MERLLVDDFDAACDILDDNGYYYDIDGGDRIMVNEEDLDDIVKLLEDEDIDVDRI